DRKLSSYDGNRSSKARDAAQPKSSFASDRGVDEGGGAVRKIPHSEIKGNKGAVGHQESSAGEVAGDCAKEGRQCVGGVEDAVVDHHGGVKVNLASVREGERHVAIVHCERRVRKRQGASRHHGQIVDYVQRNIRAGVCQQERVQRIGRPTDGQVGDSQGIRE